MSPTPEPLSPEQVDALLRPDPRSAAADLLVLRDSLQRLSAAWERIADAAGQLSRVAAQIEGHPRTPGTPLIAPRPAPHDDAERVRPRPRRAD